jgi:hypothetical protein
VPGILIEEITAGFNSSVCYVVFCFSNFLSFCNNSNTICFGIVVKNSAFLLLYLNHNPETRYPDKGFSGKCWGNTKCSSSCSQSHIIEPFLKLI